MLSLSVRVLNTLAHLAILAFVIVCLGLLEYGAWRRGTLEMVHHHKSLAAVMYVTTVALFFFIIVMLKVSEKVLKRIWFSQSEDFAESSAFPV